ncbi:unnamed protein product [Trichogramma brassicae]|uniref:Uncharacterized protein n=1 Tax=Trichogramma brassicae TaxID=86971 RepID=A0A6H5J4I4_9HYME|nr:unnamed protein product [Trichogramma brassicae]
MFYERPLKPSAVTARLNGRLYIALCRTCAEIENQAECEHEDVQDPYFSRCLGIDRRSRAARRLSNSHYIVLFFATFAIAVRFSIWRVKFTPEDNRFFLQEAYWDATSRPYGYLLFWISSRPHPIYCRFSVVYISDDAFHYVYVPSKKQIKGINALDEACREHDIAYSDSNADRAQADRLLAERALLRVLANDTPSDERTFAMLTACCMVSKLSFDKFLALSELLLFDIPPTQTTIEGSNWIHYKPISSLSDDSPIEFVIPGNGEDYIDLAHTMLSLRVSIVNKTSPSPATTTTPYVGPSWSKKILVGLEYKDIHDNEFVPVVRLLGNDFRGIRFDQINWKALTERFDDVEKYFADLLDCTDEIQGNTWSLRYTHSYDAAGMRQAGSRAGCRAGAVRRRVGAVHDLAVLYSIQIRIYIQ